MTKRFTEAFGVPIVEMDSPDNFWANPSQFASVEFELERVNNMTFRGPLWDVGEDHSLRDGLEWKLRRPMMGKKLSLAINQFFDAVEEIPAELRPVTSYRTGLHVHLNFSRSEMDSMSQLRTLVATYFLVEGLMFAYAGVDRKWCGYCWSMADANGLLHKVLDPEITEKRLHVAIRDSSRYLGLNLAALAKYGSLEFRHMEMTLDRQRAVNWINSIMYLRMFASNFGEDDMAFVNVLNKYDELGPEGFIRAVFNVRAEDFLPFINADDMKDRANHLRLVIARNNEEVKSSQKHVFLSKNPLFLRAFKDKAIKYNEQDDLVRLLSDFENNPVLSIQDRDERVRVLRDIYTVLRNEDNPARYIPIGTTIDTLRRMKVFPDEPAGVVVNVNQVLERNLNRPMYFDYGQAAQPLRDRGRPVRPDRGLLVPDDGDPQVDIDPDRGIRQRRQIPRQEWVEEIERVPAGDLDAYLGRRLRANPFVVLDDNDNPVAP